MTRGLIQAIVPGILLILFVRPALFGQTEKGAIVGTVTDSQGAVIAGATVSVTNQDTNLSQTHTTNAQGLYEAPFLTPGLYKVSATFTGFSTSVTNNVMVNVGTRVRTDLTLQIGGVSTQVEVTDRAFLVQAESAHLVEEN